MITTGMFISLTVMDAALLIYAFADSDNRNYAHIFASVIVILLSGVLGFYLQNGLVSEPGDPVWVVVTDAGVGWLFIAVGVLAFIYVVLAGFEALHDASQGRAREPED